MSSETKRKTLIEKNFLTVEEKNQLVALYRKEPKAMDIILKTISVYVAASADIRNLDLKANPGFIASVHFWVTKYLDDFFDDLLDYRKAAEDQVKSAERAQKALEAGLPDEKNQFI